MIPLRVREVDAAAVRSLRGAVLRPGLPAAAAEWPGDDDPGTVHVAAYEGGATEPVGVLTLLVEPYPGPGGVPDAAGQPPSVADPAEADSARVGASPGPGAGRGATGPGGAATGGVYQLRGMAVAPDRQGGGVGAELLRASVELVRRRGATLVWCNARLVAAPFYERAGFVRDGDVYIHPMLDIPHVRMRLAL